MHLKESFSLLPYRVLPVPQEMTEALTCFEEMDEAAVHLPKDDFMMRRSDLGAEFKSVGDAFSLRLARFLGWPVEDAGLDHYPWIYFRTMAHSRFSYLGVCHADSISPEERMGFFVVGSDLCSFDLVVSKRKPDLVVCSDSNGFSNGLLPRILEDSRFRIESFFGPICLDTPGNAVHRRGPILTGARSHGRIRRLFRIER